MNLFRKFCLLFKKNKNKQNTKSWLTPISKEELDIILNNIS